MWGIARFLIATAAGAGLGAGAALARRHLLAPPDATTAPWQEAEPASADLVTPGPVATEPASAERPPDVADLEAARSRLRERAAQLRAEMERSAR